MLTALVVTDTTGSVLALLGGVAFGLLLSASSLSAAWRWLRARSWVRWVVLGVGAIVAVVWAYLRGRDAGTEREHARQTDANRDALGETVQEHGQDAIAEAERERIAREASAKIEAELRARQAIDQPTSDDMEKLRAELEARLRGDRS